MSLLSGAQLSSHLQVQCPCGSTKSRWQGQSVGVFDLCWNMAIIIDTFSHKHAKRFWDFIPNQHFSSKVTQRLGCMIPQHSQQHKTCWIVSEILNIATFSHSQLVKLVSGRKRTIYNFCHSGVSSKTKKRHLLSVVPGAPGRTKSHQIVPFINVYQLLGLEKSGIIFTPVYQPDPSSDPQEIASTKLKKSHNKYE